jgi:hypothetical protein
MKQVTIRLNEQGEKELQKVREMMESKSAQAAIEHCLLSYRWLVDSERIAEKKLEEAQAVIKYLEEQLKNR